PETVEAFQGVVSALGVWWTRRLLLSSPRRRRPISTPPAILLLRSLCHIPSAAAYGSPLSRGRQQETLLGDSSASCQLSAPPSRRAVRRAPGAGLSPQRGSARLPRARSPARPPPPFRFLPAWRSPPHR